MPDFRAEPKVKAEPSMAFYKADNTFYLVNVPSS
jgi:hypothetical protein